MVSVQNFWQQHQFQTGISFGFDETLKQKARQIGAKWSQTYKYWYVDYNDENYQKVSSTIPNFQIIYDTSKKIETPAPGLKRSHDFTPITDCKHSSVLHLQSEFEHKALNFVKLVSKNGFRATCINTKLHQKMSFGSQLSPLELVTKCVKNKFKK